jgi:hypothetical protein
MGKKASKMKKEEREKQINKKTNNNLEKIQKFKDNYNKDTEIDNGSSVVPYQKNSNMLSKKGKTEFNNIINIAKNNVERGGKGFIKSDLQRIYELLLFKCYDKHVPVNSLDNYTTYELIAYIREIIYDPDVAIKQMEEYGYIQNNNNTKNNNTIINDNSNNTEIINDKQNDNELVKY